MMAHDGRHHGIYLLWKLLMIAERTFRRVNGPKLLKDVYEGREFVDGVAVNKVARRLAA
jgi:hypothetical protein